MPWEQLSELSAAIRRVARLLLTLISTMEGGFERNMQVGVMGEWEDGRTCFAVLRRAIARGTEGMLGSLGA